MFARVFDTAKRILGRSPSAQVLSTESVNSLPTIDTSATDAAMVTTRGGTETPGVAATPRSSVKKASDSSTKKRVLKRELDALETPTQAKRQRKAALTRTPRTKVVDATPEPEVSTEEPTQDSVEEIAETIEVAIPSNEVDEGENPTIKELLPIRRRSSPKVVVAKISPRALLEIASREETKEDDVVIVTQETEYRTPEQQAGSGYATPATSKPIDVSPSTRLRTAETRTIITATRPGGRKKKAQKDEEPKTLEVTQTTSTFVEEIPSSTNESDAFIPSQVTVVESTQPTTAHVRFGSEEPAELDKAVTMNAQGHKRYVAAPSAQKAAAVEMISDTDDDASDSDEAPEIVTTASATSKSKLAQAEADRAVRLQQAKEQAKREEREARILAEQTAKRKREEKKAKKVAKKLARQGKAAAAFTDVEEEVSRFRPDYELPTTRLPAFLPDALLSTIDDQRPPTPPPSHRGKTQEEMRKERLSHHIKFLERADKPAKDVKKGKLSVAVLGQHNKVLAPKVNKNTKNVREHWLKGREKEKKKGGKPNYQFGKMERRARGRSGFLRGED